MKKSHIISIALVFVLLINIFVSLIVPISAGKIITDATGYTKAEDVVYKSFTESGKKVIANWGARGEDALFLSTYAINYYTGNYSAENIFDNNGGSTFKNATSSDLFKELAGMMTAKHSHVTNYQETRYLYRYTDCMKNNTSTISSFYSGKSVSGTWDSGKTWNREHTWPNSKGAGKTGPGADIMMLRPTSVSENSSRGNTAYGESSGYYDPGESVHGDCARIILYTYVRWNSNVNSFVEGKSGVIENLDILLEWMEEDPVDTWEMGRNDAVQSITGVRNVFVDYPELAWQLFGRSVPENVTTPTSSSRENTSTTGTPTTATPTTEAPTTETPTTVAPTTETPTTVAPTTETPTTETPTTVAPTTETPTTETPTTETPTTVTPTTETPTTVTPTTETPTTETPTTAAPTTSEPVTETPTTDASTTVPPTTADTTTASPTEESQTTATQTTEAQRTEDTTKPSAPSDSVSSETVSPSSSTDKNDPPKKDNSAATVWFVIIAVVVAASAITVIIIFVKKRK